MDPNKRGELVESHERRFRRLLAADSAADLSGQLRTWVRLAAGKGVGINYESLFYDLRRWDRFATDVRVEWARSFWRSGEDETAPATTTVETAAS